MIKVIYSDLDGTLVDYNEHGAFISSKNKEAVNLWTKENYFGVATGRNIPTISFISDDINININMPYVLLNGSLIYDHKNKKIVYKKTICKEIIDEAIDFLKENQLAYLILVTDSKSYHVGKYNYELFGKSWVEFKEIEKDEIDYDSILKINFIVSKENNSKLIEEIKNLKHYNKVSLIPSSIHFIELVDKSVSKYNGILKALEYLNIKEYELIAIGDYINDIHMLKNSDIAFVPENAEESVKEVADYIVKSYKEDAVSDMIEILKNM